MYNLEDISNSIMEGEIVISTDIDDDKLSDVFLLYNYIGDNNQVLYQYLDRNILNIEDGVMFLNHYNLSKDDYIKLCVLHNKKVSDYNKNNKPRKLFLPILK